jgi:hypothetical protein
LAAIAITIAAYFNCWTLYILYKRRKTTTTTKTKTTVQSTTHNISMTTNYVQQKQQKSMMKKLTNRVEANMLVITIILFVTMSFKNTCHGLLMFGILNPGAAPLNSFATDLLSLINPFLLVFTSSDVRKLLISMMFCRKYQPF